MSTIVVTGATGNVGGAVVSALLERGHKVRAVVRSRSDPLPGVERVVGDLDDAATVAPALGGAEGLFLLAGYTGERDLLAAAAAAAAAAGVRRVVLLSGGGTASQDPDNAVSRFQLAAEAHVKDSGLEWTILRPQAFFTNVLRWPAVRDGGGLVRAPFADVSVSAVDPADIGAVAAVALTENGHAGRTYTLSGPQSLRPADQVATPVDVAGPELRFKAQSDNEARAEMSAACGRGFRRAQVGSVGVAGETRPVS